MLLNHFSELVSIPRLIIEILEKFVHLVQMEVVRGLLHPLCQKGASEIQRATVDSELTTSQIARHKVNETETPHLFMSQRVTQQSPRKLKNKQNNN